MGLISILQCLLKLVLNCCHTQTLLFFMCFEALLRWRYLLLLRQIVRLDRFKLLFLLVFLISGTECSELFGSDVVLTEAVGAPSHRL